MNTHQILLLATAIQESGYSVYNSTEYTKKYFKNNKATIEKIDNLYKEIKTRKTAPNTKISIEYKDHLGTIQKKSFKTKHEAQARYDYLTELENKTIQFAPTDSGNARFNYETERATIAQALNLNDPKQETPTEAIMTDTENSINNYHAVYDKATGKVLDVFAGSYKAQEFANGFKGTAASTYISTEIYDAFHNGETIIRQESGVMEIQEKQSDLLGRTVAFKGTELGIIKEVKNGPVGWSLTDKTRIVLDNGHSIRYPFEDESGYEVLPVITLDPATIKYMEDRQKHNDQAEEHNRLRRVGQEALPGIRFQDAAEVGRVWEAKQKGELTDAQWNEYTADLISSNKVTIMTRADYEAKPPFDDEYTGPRYKYGMRNRPYGFATAPKGAILMTYKPEDKELGSRHGTIEYPFELTKDDVQSFELVDFQHATRMEALYHSTVLHYETEMQRRGFTTTFGEHEQSMIATLDLPATETLPERTFSTRIFQDDQGYHVDLNKDSIGRSIELVYDTPEQIDIPRALNWIDSKLAEHMLDYDSTKNMYIIPPELAALNTNDPDFAQHVMEMDEGHVVTYSPKESVLNIDASAKAQGLEVEWRNIEDGDYGPAIAALMTHNSTGDIAEAHIYADGKAMFFLNGERYRGDYYYATSDDETQTAAIKELSNTLKYTPEFTYHIIPGMDDHLVKMKKSGRSIGHVQAGKLAEFESGDFRVFKPFQNWKMTYSKKLQDYLNLNENTVAIGETKVSIKINNILYEDGLSNINLNQTERKIFKALDNAIIQQINYSKSTENLDSFTKAQLERLQKYGADENIKEVAKRLLENPVIEVNATLSNKPTVTVDSGTAIIETDKLKSLAFTLAQHTDEPLSYKELSTATGLTNADIDKNWTLANKIADAALKDSNGRDLVYQIDRHTHMELTGPLSVIYSQSESDIKEEPMFYSKAIGWSKYGDETTTFTNEELKTFSVSDITCSKSDALTMKLDDAFKLVESDKENTKHQGTYIKGQIILNHAHALKETSEMRLKNTMYDPALEQHKITQAEYIITNINRHELKNEVFKLDLDAAMGGNPLAHDHEERRKSIIEQIDNYAINRKTNPERSPYLNPTTPKQEDLKMENSQETVSAQTEYKITGAKLAEKFDYLMKAQTKNLNFLENHLERIRTMPDVVEQPNKRTGEVFTATKAQVLAQMARTEAINSMTDNKYIFNIKEMKKINSKIASGEISSEDVKIHAKMNDVKDKLASGEITKEAAAEAQAGYVPNPELVKYDKYKAQNARFNKETNHPEKKALFAVEFKKAFAEHCEEAGIKNKIEETKTNLENTAYLLSKVKALPDQEFTIRIKEQRKLPNLANDVNFGKQLETALAAHAPAPAPEKKPKARKH